MDLKQAFETAIKGEIEGRELYKAAADKTDDKKAGKVFKMLADEEQTHLDTLVKLATEYSEGRDVTVPDLPKPTTFEDAESPIFTREFKDKVGNKDFEMSTMSIGIKLELESEKFYKEMAQASDQDKLKEFFNYLADWERGHYDYLQKQIGFLDSYYKNKYSFFRF